MKDKNIITFWDSVYCQDFMVVLTRSHKKFCEIAKKETGFAPENCNEQVSGEFHGLTNKHCSLALIWSPDKGLNLLHEVFHACAWVLRNREIFLTEETEETYAYYYTYIMRMINSLTKNKGGSK